MWCWEVVNDCPCTVDQPGQVIQIDLRSPRYIDKILVYRTVIPYDVLSVYFTLHIGNTGSVTSDPVLINEQRVFTGEPSRLYKVDQTARYITFFKDTGANFCMCKVMVYGS
ncbi:hypothetical protein Hamer_G002492 [Homarus americanus]|uniref:Uncharacterized protein n=1 Tax=Homarus americanus TaxID=6706 RepID=A0A8J5MYW2_HOMAM|nr:hypothetical protein Hamer_G002492 [Homarus americanus]